MKLKNLLLSLIIFSIFFSSYYVTRVSAQNIEQNDNQRIKYLLNVTPAIVSFEIIPGKTESIDLTVENFLDQPMGIRTSLEPFTYPDQRADYLKGSLLLKWANISQNEFIIDPKSKKEITISLKIPSNAPLGGQYGVLFLTPFYSQTINSDIPTVLSKIGVLLIGTYGKTDFEKLEKNVSVSSFELPIITDKKIIEATFRIHNSYYNHFTGKPFISTSSVLGKDKKDYELEEKNILPKTDRLWQQNLEIDPKFHVGEGNQITKDAYFIYFSGSSYLKYSLILVLLLILFIYRKRVKKAVKILLTSR